MKKYALWMVIFVIWAVLSGIPLIAQTTDCPGALPPRLTVSGQGRVLPGDPNNLRFTPSLSGRVINQMPAGGVFTVREGPVCADGYEWWNVDYKGNRGWTAEGEGLNYWLVPISWDRPVITRDNAAQVASVGALGFGYTHDLRWSPDGKAITVISASGLWQYDPNHLTAPAHLLEPAPQSEWTQLIVTSPDGTERASVSVFSSQRDNQIHLLNRTTGKEITLLIDGGPRGDLVVTLAFSPDSSVLAASICTANINTSTVCKSGELRVWDARTGNLRFSAQIPPADVFTLTFSPDAKLLVSGSRYGEGVIVWDVNTGKPILTSDHGHDAVFSPDNTLLVYALANDIHVWDTAARADRTILKAHERPVRQLVFSPDGTLLASSDTAFSSPTDSVPSTVHLWDMRTLAPQPFAAFDHGGDTQAMVLSPHNHFLVTFSWQEVGIDAGIIKLWDIPSGRLRMSIPNDVFRYALEAAFSPDETRMAILNIDGQLRLFNTRTGRQMASVRGFGGTIDVIAFSPDGSAVFGAGRVWDVATGWQRFTMPDVWGVAFSPDGRHIAAAENNSLKLWDAHTGELQKTIQGEFGFSQSMAFTPDGRTIAVDTQSGTTNGIKLVDVTTGKVIDTYPRSASEMAFSPDGRLLAFAAGGTEVWDRQAHRLLFDVDALPPYLPCTAFSPDGQLLAVCTSGDDHAELWDVAQHRLKLRLITEDEGTPSRASLENRFEISFSVAAKRIYNSGAFDAAFSPDGKILATTDGELRFWDVQTGQLLATVPGAGGKIAFSPDGATIVSASGPCIGCDGESPQLEAVQLFGVPEPGK